MKLIKPSFERVTLEEYSLEGMYKHIEKCGRVCYKSEHKITKDSHTKFVENLIKRGHTSVLEHGTLYFTAVPKDIELSNKSHFFTKICSSPYTRYYTGRGSGLTYITTNFRVLHELGLDIPEVLKFAEYSPTFHEKRKTIRFICDRAIANELVRHRVFSFSQESTRYVKYDELTFIAPPWITSVDEHNKFNIKDAPLDEFHWFSRLMDIESTYKTLITESKWSPQKARTILPLSLKTELYMTGFLSDWLEFLKLRDTEAAHPQMRELVKGLNIAISL